MIKYVIFAAVATTVLAFPSFRTRIPNGDKVPNPCPGGGTWQGVGHLNSTGGGPLNPFGVDFDAALFQWTQALCRLDSDKDGKTNGEELGDPNCTFTAAVPGTLLPPTGNPGTMLKLAVFTLAVATVILGHPSFKGLIPNGDKVPNPCPAGGVWPGVGHFNISGGGERNPFGVDFEAANLIWTVALCKLDSDLDGKTNGAELGDPGCIWTPTNNAPVLPPLSHPGICDPISAPACKDQRVVC
ncbi:unnamed protein product [Lymnaea stagnalis]|uniref:Temptin Cys/Cys disulfide domain-containing protein n=1 Tax=Lymnaea stagnalis TaxID=6523 RepID=A0AAV2HJD0_LYMST